MYDHRRWTTTIFHSCMQVTEPFWPGAYGRHSVQELHRKC